MAIKNYTTTVDAYTSLGEIQGALAKAGAKKIMIDYDDGGYPCGVMFGMVGPMGGQMFCLPVNVDGVAAVFARQKVKNQTANRRARPHGVMCAIGCWRSWRSLNPGWQPQTK